MALLGSLFAVGLRYQINCEIEFYLQAKLRKFLDNNEDYKRAYKGPSSVYEYLHLFLLNLLNLQVFRNSVLFG